MMALILQPVLIKGLYVLTEVKYFKWWERLAMLERCSTMVRVKLGLLSTIP